MGVGNVLMGDDGVGPAAVEALRREGVDAELIDAGLAFGEVLCDLAPDRPLIVIDAVRGPGGPGSVYRLSPADLDGTSETAPALSLHEVSVLPALHMERIAGRDFDDVTLFGVEPQRLAWGEGLSRSASDGLAKLVMMIRRYLDERDGPERAAAACGSEMI